VFLVWHDANGHGGWRPDPPVKAVKRGIQKTPDATFDSHSCQLHQHAFSPHVVTSLAQIHEHQEGGLTLAFPAFNNGTQVEHLLLTRSGAAEPSLAF